MMIWGGLSHHSSMIYMVGYHDDMGGSHHSSMIYRVGYHDDWGGGHIIAP